VVGGNVEIATSFGGRTRNDRKKAAMTIDHYPSI